MHQADAPPGQQGFGNLFQIGFRGLHSLGGVFALLDQGADDVHLLPGGNALVQIGEHIPPLFSRDRVGFNGHPAGGQLVQNGHVQIAVHQQAQGAGNGGGAHDQQVRRAGLAGQLAPLAYAEPVLLVHNGQPQPGKLHPGAQHRVGAHHQVGLAICNGGQCGLFCRRLHAAGEQRHPKPEGGQRFLQIFGVLHRQNFGRGHQGALPAVQGGQVDARRRHQGFAAAHIALQKTVHGGGAAQVGGDLLGGPALGAGGGKGQAGPERLQRARLHGGGGALLAPAAAEGEGQLQAQQLLKNQAAAGGGDLLRPGGAVDHPHGGPLVRQAIPAAHLRGQGVRQGNALLQRLDHAPADDGAGKPLGLGVDGGKGRGFHLGASAHHRGDHLPRGEGAAHPPGKPVGFVHQQLVGGVGDVEPGEGEGGRVVPGLHLDQGAAAGQAGGAQLGVNGGLDHHLFPGGGAEHRHRVGVVHIAAGVVGQQVAHGDDAQPGKLFGQHRANPLEKLHLILTVHKNTTFRGTSKRAGRPQKSAALPERTAGESGAELHELLNHPHAAAYSTPSM